MRGAGVQGGQESCKQSQTRQRHFNRIEIRMQRNEQTSLTFVINYKVLGTGKFLTRDFILNGTMVAREIKNFTLFMTIFYLPPLSHFLQPPHFALPWLMKSPPCGDLTFECARTLPSLMRIPLQGQRFFVKYLCRKASIFSSWKVI